MKCSQCGTKNDPQSKFCKECGADLQNPSKAPVITVISELYGKEVDVLFFIENFSGKITGIVNPTEDQIGRYREGILQRVTIDTPSNSEPDENIGAVLTFIRQSKEYLGEKYNETQYRNFSTADLKKEYLKLFERILKEKSSKGDAPKPMPAPEKK
ncbi:MAG TPA: zinc ribbon domain-containing protein [bacterium]|nr:zinc ribbon domain-containing protein [bacterium]